MDTQPGRRAHPEGEQTRLGARGGPEAAAVPQDTEHSRAAAGSADPRATELGRGAVGGDRVARTELGARAQRADCREGAEVRFGPGIRPAPAWNPPVTGTRGRDRTRRGAVLPMLTALVIAAVLAYLLLWRADPLAVSGAEVAPAADPGRACDVTVDVVGTIRTNGQAGTIEYRWLRSDGESTAVLSQTVAADTTSVQVHLLWTLAGKGTYPASATLQVLRPQPVDATGGFTYSCR